MFIRDDYIPDMEYEDELEEEYAYYQDIIEDNKRREQDLSWLYDKEDDEEWRDIPGYEGMYQVSNKGRVKSLARDVIRWNKGTYTQPERILEPYLKNGYPTVALRKENKETFRGGVHILVARAFIPNPENKSFIDHWDTNKENNKVSNLSWVTREENEQNCLTCYHRSISMKGKPSKLKGRKIPKEQVEKSLLTKHRNGTKHLQEDENGFLIYKNGLIDPSKYE